MRGSHRNGLGWTNAAVRFVGSHKWILATTHIVFVCVLSAMRQHNGLVAAGGTCPSSTAAPTHHPLFLDLAAAGKTATRHKKQGGRRLAAAVP